MATLKESNFAAALTAAEAARQVAYAAAFTTYGGVFANLATYQAAIVTADNAYVDAVQSAATTAGISPTVQGTIYPGVRPNAWSSILT